MSDSSTHPPRTEGDEFVRMRQSRRRVFIAASSIILCTAVVGITFFSTKTVIVQVAPERAVETASLTKKTGLAVVVDTETHYWTSVQVQVEAEGFQPQIITLDRSSSSPFSVELTPKPGVITLVMDEVLEPMRSEFSLEVIGHSEWVSLPESVELTQGNYDLIVLGPDGYEKTDSIAVEGYGVKQTYRIDPLPMGKFVIRTEPQEATISINGRMFGLGFYTGSAIVGEHQITVEAPNYFSRTLTIEVEEDSYTNLETVRLKPRPATLNLASNPNEASVLVNGEFVGSTPLEHTLEPGNHQLEIRKANYQPVQESLELNPGQLLTRSFELDPVTFQVTVKASRKASIALNGEDQGHTPIDLKVIAGDLVSLSRDGYASQSVTIKGHELQERTIEFEMIEVELHLYNQAPSITKVQGSIDLKKFQSAHARYTAPAYLAEDNRRRTREVEITRAFYMGVHEITQAEFALFDSTVKPAKGEEKLPITDIAWIHAVRFCNWLSAQEGLEPAYQIFPDGHVELQLEALGYRLPTEAEWELVTHYDFQRDKPIAPFAWGEGTKPPTNIGNLAGFEARSTRRGHISDYADSHAELAPVGSYRSNANGIHDLVGNASEWVHDYYKTQINGWDESLTDPTGPLSGLDRLVKGANYQTVQLKEAAITARKVVGYKDKSVGFRIARWIY